MARKICVVTGTRAEYGMLRTVMDQIRNRGLELSVVVAGMHLSAEFGLTARQVANDGYPVVAHVDMLLGRDDNAAMAKGTGLGILGMAQAFEGVAPAIALVLGDRVEAFAGATAASLMNIPVAHIHGGDRSGGLDESLRHAITKLAHLHFPATRSSRERILRLGEDAAQVFLTGSPAIDEVAAATLISRSDLGGRLGIDLSQPYLLLVQHPVSTDPVTAADEMKESLEAVLTSGLRPVVIYPNADPGGRAMIRVIRSYSRDRFLGIFSSLERIEYLNLLRHATVLVGNTSSGLIEAPSYRVPAVNVGHRQVGRERASNVLDVNPDRHSITEGIRTVVSEREFRERLATCVNPYGDGQAGRRIADVLASVDLGHGLLRKRLIEVVPDSGDHPR